LTKNSAGALASISRTLCDSAAHLAPHALSLPESVDREPKRKEPSTTSNSFIVTDLSIPFPALPAAVDRGAC
jgi:hypothetical protein